jgi:hypothetical protein
MAKTKEETRAKSKEEALGETRLEIFSFEELGKERVESAATAASGYLTKMYVLYAKLAIKALRRRSHVAR